MEKLERKLVGRQPALHRWDEYSPELAGPQRDQQPESEERYL